MNELEVTRILAISLTLLLMLCTFMFTLIMYNTNLLIKEIKNKLLDDYEKGHKDGFMEGRNRNNFEITEVRKR